MNIKTIYCIRHGLALHNILFKRIGTDAYTKYRDTELVNKGINQAQDLGDNWDELNNIDLVMVSPCARTLNTGKYIFKNKPRIPIIAFDFLIEQGQKVLNGGSTFGDFKNRSQDFDFGVNFLLVEKKSKKLF